MKIHGLVFLAVLCLTEMASAQIGAITSDQGFLPPSPQKLDAAPAEPMPIAVPAKPSIETELQQFRNELREFQALREEVARNTKATDQATDHLSNHQRQELMDLLAKLAKKSLARKSAAVPSPVYAEPVIQPSVTMPAQSFPVQATDSGSVEIADPFALGKVLFRSGDFVGAEKAFRRAIVTTENEMTLKYLVATCLRRQSRWQPAMEAYKAIADSNQDPVLRDLAKWQLDNIRWHQQSESQLEQIKQQREKRSDPTNGQSTNAGTNPRR